MKNLQKKLRLLSIVLMVGLFFGSMILPVKAYVQKPGTVNEAVTLRQNADASSSQVMQLTSGQAVDVNNEITGADGATWYQVIVNKTVLGYVPASTVTISDGSAPTTGSTTQQIQTVTVTERIGKVTVNSAIRVRQEATTSSNQIASMQQNATFLVIEDVNAADGYVWHKVEYDDNGTMIVGYVRSDLVKVEEVSKQVEQIVEVPVDIPEEEPEEKAPYTINSQVNAEGTTVWYLVNSATGDSKEISALFTVQPEEKSGNGVYKIIVVILLILVILAAGAATFFFMRWRDAEEFITELREKQARAKKQTLPNRTPSNTGQPVKASAKTAPTTGVTSTPQPTAQQPVKPAAPAPQPTAQQPVKQAAPTPQPTAQQPVKQAVPTPQPTAQQPVKQAVPTPQPAVQQPVKQAVPTPQPTSQPKQEQQVKSTVMPDTMDIVKATQQELKNSAAANTPKQQSAWKSKNFLTDDDDLEFDFLDADDK